MRLRAWLTRYATEALVLAVAVAGQVETWAAPVDGPKGAAVAAALLGTLPLLLRRHFPFAAPALAFTALAGVSLAYPAAVSRGTSFTFLSLLLAFWTVGAQSDRQQAVAGAALGMAALAVIAQSAGRAADVETGDLGLALVPWLVIAAGLSLGAFALRRRGERAAELQERADRLERAREERARAAVAAERARIARDLHDVIAHSMSVMTIQGGAARLLLEQDPRRAREPLLVVEETGRQAMGEMRRLLGIVHEDEPRVALAPQPGIADLDALVEQVRRAGLPVELTMQGEPKVPAPGVELAAYRIVQEALTNTLKHAGPARARVSARYEADALRLEIADDGRGGSKRRGGGHGLVGMRERVALYGGELEAGPRAQGGFAVRARLPLGREP
jgi:signal transduction histidine kinase